MKIKISLSIIYTVLIASITSYGNESINLKLNKSFFSLMQINLGESSPEILFKKFGKVEPLKRNDTKHDPYVYCYSVKSQESSDIITIKFEAGWYYSFEKLNGFEIILNKEDKDIEKCCKIQEKDFNILIGNNISLGMKYKDFKKQIPGNPNIQGNKLIYNYEKYEEYSKPKEKFFMKNKIYRVKGEWIYSHIEADFINEKLVRYYISLSGEPNFEILNSSN